eukprot:m.264866 g.264866  ORF g.264866 m.264866 type:complete len:140 (-) comp58596_c0_seq1:225-644(-)
MASQKAVSDSQAKVQEYFQEHGIPQLLENLTASLVYAKPDNPRQFLIEEMETLRASRDGNAQPKGFMDESDLGAIFGMFDIQRSGYITLATYKQAMKAAGISTANPQPEGYNFDRISKSAFLDEGKRGLTKLHSTFATA